MKALVVYDSRSGYTELIARAVGEALEGPLDVFVVRAGAPGSFDVAHVDLLVVGGPTEGHGATPVMRRWLESLGVDTLAGLPAAAFDTRLNWPKLLSGSAADEIATALRGAGCRLVMKPESFIVHGRVNPMPGQSELDHAKGWANLVFDGLPMPVA
jgi:flavodoxin